MGNGLTDVWRDYNLESGNDPQRLVDFVTVSSDFYPELRQYVAAQAQAWLEDRRREQDVEGEEDEE